MSYAASPWPSARVRADRWRLRKINLAVPKGGFLSITGPSGSGKSALLRLIAGTEKPSAGTVWLNGKDLWRMRFFKRRRFCRETFAQVPRTLDVRRYKTTIDVVAATAPRNLNKEAKRAHAVDMLDRVGLGSRLTHQPSTLSGGERRRLNSGPRPGRGQANRVGQGTDRTGRSHHGPGSWP